VGWVLTAIGQLGLDRALPVAVLPLGTGNDLARVLGWGGGFTGGPKELSGVLNDVGNAHVAMLDRWDVAMEDTHSRLHQGGGTPSRGGGGLARKELTLNNYCGVGCDAQIALNFHEQRNRTPTLFRSRLTNKLWYSNIGAVETVAPKVAGLAKYVSIWCDDDEDPLMLPAGIEGLIVLNIDSYGGGARLWRPQSSSLRTSFLGGGWEEEGSAGASKGTSFDGEVEFGEASMQDGLVEVVGVYGALHLGQLQVGLASAVHLRQCGKVRIEMRKEYPVQVDGEPWMQHPCVITIDPTNRQATMLRKTNTEMGEVMAEMTAVLDWAEEESVINGKQRDLLMHEIARRVVKVVANERDLVTTDG